MPSSQSMIRQSGKSIRLLYVIYSENLLQSGILRSQVQKMLSNMHQIYTVEDNSAPYSSANLEIIRLLSFVNPVSLIRRGKEWKLLKSDLLRAGVELRLRPLIAKPVWPWFLEVFGLLFCLPIILYEILSARINILHSRSYFASILANLSAKITHSKHIFDPRGPLPEEFVLNNVIKKGSGTYKFWKKVEGYLFRNCDAVITVVPYFREQFFSAGAKKVVFVPNRGNIEEFNHEAILARKIQKKADSTSPVLLFTGEKMDSTWYPPERVAQHFKHLKCIIPNLRLQLLTNQNHEFIRHRLVQSGIAKEDFSIDASKPSEMAARIARADLALLLGLTPAADWSVWPVKFAEYLGSGIPLIAEQEVGTDLTREIDKWGIGCVVDRNSPASYENAINIITNQGVYASNCIKYARKRMDLNKTAKQYFRLYKQVLADD